MNGIHKYSHSTNRGIGIKFFISTPDSNEVTVYRWMIPCQREHLEWKKVIRKLDRITNSKYGEFELSWNDGFHDCALMDSKDLRSAIEDMSGKCGQDSCVHIKVKALAPKVDYKIPEPSASGSSRSPDLPPPYSELPPSNSPANRSQRSDGQRGNVIIIHRD